MGVVTLEGFRTAVRLSLDDRSDLDTATGEALLNRWVNDAYRHVCLPSVFRQPAMQKSDDFTLAEATDPPQYALPSDCYAVEFVINETKAVRYTPDQPRELLEQETGNDYLYGRRGNSLIIRASSATDGDTARVYYWARPALLTDDDDVTEIEEYWDQVIITLASAYGAANLGMLDKADYYDERAGRLINDHREARSFEANDRGWRNDVVPVVDYSRPR